MTTIAPGLSTAGLAMAKLGRGVSRRVQVEDDPTVYPDWEAVGRSPTECAVVRDLEPVLTRYLAERGMSCFVGSDNFIYYVKGNNKACVSPDLYTLPGVLPDARPAETLGAKGEGCWKKWLHKAIPNFALEVKAPRNPRKDELQSPARHDALGTKELIVYDPFIERRRGGRKRFCVYRKTDAGAWEIVEHTNADRVFSEQLGAFLVARGRDDGSMLRLGLGPNGDDLVPLDGERIAQEARRADEEARRADEEARRADDANRRVAELEAELARLRASVQEAKQDR